MLPAKYFWWHGFLLELCKIFQGLETIFKVVMYNVYCKQKAIHIIVFVHYLCQSGVFGDILAADSFHTRLCTVLMA